MPELTRRRYPERHDCWHVYHGDVHVGHTRKAHRQPGRHRPMGVALRLLSGIPPGRIRGGTSASLDEARAGFEEAWKVFLAARTEADFRGWRDQRDWTARKYALWDAGKAGDL